MGNFPFLLQAAVSYMSVSYWRGLAVQKTNGEYWHKHMKNKTSTEKLKKWLSENFYLIVKKVCHHFTFEVHRKTDS